MKDFSQIKWWLNYNPLSKEEYDLLHAPQFITKQTKYDSFAELEEDWFSLLPGSNITLGDKKLTFGESATWFIDSLFKMHVDDKTLVITSSLEHPSVQENCKKVKNYLTIPYDEIQNLNINRFVEKLNGGNYNKVFVYIIGTCISSGEITSQSFYIKLKEYCKSKKIRVILTVDDVHGMFWVPRDYSIFDYIIYTCHACVDEYDMGVLLSKDGDLGEQDLFKGTEYLERLKIILKRKDKAYLLYYILQNYFEELLTLPGYKLAERGSRHLFSIKVNNCKSAEWLEEKMKEYSIRLESSQEALNYILLRTGWFIRDPERLIPGLQQLEKYMSLLTANELLK